MSHRSRPPSPPAALARGAGASRHARRPVWGPPREGDGGAWAPPLPAEQAAVGRVVRDLVPSADAHRLRRIASSVGPGHPTPITLVLDVAQTAIPLTCQAGEPVDVLTWRFATQVQEYLLDRGRQPVPCCPAHRHSLVPDIDLVGAWWACPGGRIHHACPIGVLNE